MTSLVHAPFVALSILYIHAVIVCLLRHWWSCETMQCRRRRLSNVLTLSIANRSIGGIVASMFMASYDTVLYAYTLRHCTFSNSFQLTLTCSSNPVQIGAPYRSAELAILTSSFLLDSIGPRRNT